MLGGMRCSLANIFSVRTARQWLRAGIFAEVVSAATVAAVAIPVTLRSQANLIQMMDTAVHIAV
jgi:hypothetical protein